MLRHLKATNGFAKLVAGLGIVQCIFKGTARGANAHSGQAQTLIAQSVFADSPAMVELTKQSVTWHAHVGKSNFCCSNGVLAQGGDLAHFDTGQFGVNHEGADTQLFFA